MKTILSALCLLLFSGLSLAGDFTKYKWESERKRYTLTDEENALGEYILKQHVQYDYVQEEDNFIMYETIHRIVRVNNSEAIQHHNRIYISMRSVINLAELKARSINAEGKVVNFDINNMKELKDEESGNGYRIFAIEGVEQGSEIEYYYILKKQANLFDWVFMQYQMPVKNSSFLLSCPKHLLFDFASYGGYPDVKKAEGSKEDERNTYKASCENVVALKEENFSSFNACRQRIEFKIAYNTAKSQTRMFTWDEAARSYYRVLTSVDKDDEKALEKFFKTLNDNSSAQPEERIRNIEDKIKSGVSINPNTQDPSLDKPASIIKYKLASRNGITKLFLLTFERLKIDCQLVVTCSRDSRKFDQKFDSWSYLDEYVLFFPATKNYLAPTASALRYPLVPPDYTAQKGLFIEPFEIGNVKSALGSVKDIPALDYTYNSDNLNVQVNFNEGLSSNRILFKREFMGYYAALLKENYQVSNEHDRTEMITGLLKDTAPDPTITKWSVKLPESKSVSFLMDVDFNSSHFIETAGPRILFKVGELIGPQVEMYRDDKRMTDIENDFNRGYDRTITVNIPDGYQVRNPEVTKLNVIYQDKDQQPYLFTSDYNLKDNQIVITIKEYYKEIYAPLARYEDYRKVINAAADFNKVTLVLEKKK